MTRDLVPYRDTERVIARATAWADLSDAERKRRAVAAAQEHDHAALWDIAEAYLTLYGRKGGAISPLTLAAYRQALLPPTGWPPTEPRTRDAPPPLTLFVAWQGENLLHPSLMAGARWLRQLEGRGYITSTVRKYLAAGNAFYAALRLAGATDADPFKDVHPAPDPTPRSEKRGPYSDAEIIRMLAHAEGPDRLLVLLGADAGLRVSELTALAWADVHLPERRLAVREGKGGRQRTVPISARLARELAAQQPNGSLYVLPYDVAPLTPRRGRPRKDPTDLQPTSKRTRAWRRLREIATAAGVSFRGKAVHGLRHRAGTKLYRRRENIRDVMALLGHTNPSTAMVYAEYADDGMRREVEGWDE
jgi:integrase/recombinase XerC